MRRLRSSAQKALVSRVLCLFDKRIPQLVKKGVESSFGIRRDLDTNKDLADIYKSNQFATHKKVKLKMGEMGG